ncbi:RHS repeat-associated core domain-containing protein, partial [Pantoea agglomerans]
HNRVTELNGIRWQYDIHGRTTEKDDGQTRWRYRYDGEHRLTDVISEPRDRNKPRTKVSFRYDPLGRRISKTSQQLLQGRPSGNAVTTRFVWEGYRLLQEIHDGIPLTYVYSDSQSYEPLARIDGVESPEIYWFHNAANGMPELLTDGEGQKAWEGINSPWGKLLRESSQRVPVVEQNLRMQGQYLDRETGLHYNLFRYYDPDSGRFTQQDPIGLSGGINLYQYAPNALGWVDPWGLSRCKPDFYVGPDGPSATMPSTAYRYMNTKFAKQTMESKSAPLSYFGYTKYKTGSEARDAYQIFYEKGNPESWSDARLLGEFDTLQLYKNGVPQVKVPLANGDKGPGYELFTSAYPQYGRGGALQLLPTEKGYSVLFDKVDIIPE